MGQQGSLLLTSHRAHAKRPWARTTNFILSSPMGGHEPPPPSLLSPLLPCHGGGTTHPPAVSDAQVLVRISHRHRRRLGLLV